MNTIRFMTYHVNRGRGADGRTDWERVAKVIAAAAPDVAAFQDVGGGEDANPLRRYGEKLGMAWYGPDRAGSNGFLSYYPIRSVKEFSLGAGGTCLAGDLDFKGKRVHLFNVRLDPSPGRLRWQLGSLLGEELLGNDALPCPTVVMGDFASTMWGMSGLSLGSSLRQARRPIWSATYPARLPLVARDRVYLRGQIRVVDSRIIRSALSRQASSHLPHLLTLQIGDTASYLRLEKIKGAPLEPAAGC